MQFRTQIPIVKSSHPIGYGSKVVALGSCFAENMAEKLAYFQFQHTVNPFGILFHPPALEKSITRAVSGKAFEASDIFFHNERWHCYDVHSALSASDPEKMLQHLNAQNEVLQSSIANATHLLITFGTAWVYRHSQTGLVVANCHKVPQKQFHKELLSVETISASIRDTITALQTANPKAQLVFTISPVRHSKDGFVENQWSKANLIAALHQTLREFEAADYFPAYEILMDELRDYRFYAEDMLHPNSIAIDYIWERFSETQVAPEAITTMEEIGNIRKSLLHRPFNPDSEAHQAMLSQLQNRIGILQQKFPHLTF